MPIRIVCINGDSKMATTDNKMVSNKMKEEFKRARQSKFAKGAAARSIMDYFKKLNEEEKSKH